MTDNEKQVLEALAILLGPGLTEHVRFVYNTQQNAPIVVHFRSKLLPGEEESFASLFLGLSRDYPKIKNTLTDRMLYDSSVKKKSIGRKLTSTRLVVNQINIPANINLDFADLGAFKDTPIMKLTEHQLARLLEHIFIIWNDLPGGLRKPRKLKEDHIRGYVKLRASYNHDEIIEGLQVYGKWAKAKEESETAGETKAFWFHWWDLDQFMISNKSMQRVEGGWRNLVRSVGIPEEYAHLKKANDQEKNEDRKTDWIDKYTDRIISGEDVSDDAHIASEYEDEIKEALKRKNYVQ